MTWFKVDDNLALHPKVISAGATQRDRNEALGLWVRAGSWCAQQLTDGHVPAEMVELLGGKKVADRLVKAGLWLPQRGGSYQYHEWEERQPTKQQVEAERRATRERQAQWRANRARRGPDEENSHGDR